jgi:hypothetical protein
MPVHGSLVEDGFGEAVEAVAAFIILDVRVGVGGLDCLNETCVVGEKAESVSCGGAGEGSAAGAPRETLG